jgi:hypothetical protein
VKATLECKFGDDDGFDADCAAFKAWTDLEEPFKEGKNDPTLVNLLEDDDKRVRLLGAMELEEHGERYKKEKPLADRVLDAGDKETLEIICAPLGGSIGETDLAASGAFERIAKMAKTHAQKEMRGRIVSRLLDNNKDSDDAFRMTKEMTSDADLDVRVAAIEALSRGGDKFVTDACAALAAATKDNGEARVAAAAARKLAHMKKCADRYDLALSTMEARLTAGTLGYWYFCSALWNMCEDPHGTPDHRKRAIAIAKKVVESSAEDQATRLEALDAIVRCDTSGGYKAYLPKFKNDKDKQVADKAARLLAPKKK